jgi:hypothetical protein
MATRAQMAAYVQPPVYPEQGLTTDYDVLATAIRVRGVEDLAGCAEMLDAAEAVPLIASRQGHMRQSRPGPAATW